MLYTKDSIRRAFWDVFHASGERWFSYFGSDEAQNTFTEQEWAEFEKALDKAAGVTK